MVLSQKSVPLSLDKENIPATYEYFYTIIFIRDEMIMSKTKRKNLVDDIVELLGVGKRAVEKKIYTKRINGVNDFKGRELKAIADFLNIAVDDLYTD